ncbi:MAG: MauE/DoxX family redox-associated membrane protein [Chthoniobacterales bacterium]
MTAAERQARASWVWVVRLILALVVGGIFVAAGVLKVRDPLRFASDVGNYALISWPLGVRVAFYLPWLEIICGLALIFQRFLAGAIVVTFAMTVVFIGVTIWARAHGIDVSCGCFGTISSNLTLTWHFVLNGGILAALLALWLLRKSPAAQD